MGRLVMALALVSLTAAGCAASQSRPSGKVSVVVSLGTGFNPPHHTYTLRCGPAGGTMPDADAACGALADYVKHRSDPGRFCSGFLPRTPSAVVAGRFDGHRLHFEITPGSWCGSSNTLMRDYWVLSTFPCSTRVFRYSNQHPYSKGIAPARCLRGR
jgi:hypothetical protein